MEVFNHQDEREGYKPRQQQESLLIISWLIVLAGVGSLIALCYLFA